MNQEQMIRLYEPYPSNQQVEQFKLIMDEWAKHIAIEFAKWMDDKGYTQIEDKWESLNDLKGRTSEELHERFLNDINK